MVYDINTAYAYLEKQLIILMLLFIVVILVNCTICLFLKYPCYNRLFGKHRLQISKFKNVKKKSRKRQGVTDYNKFFGATLAICLLLLLYMIPIALDIYTESIFVFEGNYCVKESYYVRSQYYSKIFLGEDEHDLCLIDKTQIPSNGEYYGTIVYSKYTKKLFFYSYNYVSR